MNNFYRGSFILSCLMFFLILSQSSVVEGEGQLVRRSEVSPFWTVCDILVETDMPEKGMDELIKELKSKFVDDRHDAETELLSRKDDPASALRPLLDGDDQVLRYHVSRILSKMGKAEGPDPFPPLETSGGAREDMKALGDQLLGEDMGLSIKASRTLAGLGAPAVDTLVGAMINTTDPNRMWVILEALADIGEGSVRPLIPISWDKKYTYETRRAAETSIVRVGPRIAGLLVEALARSSEKDERYILARMLGDLGYADAIDGLIPFLTDADPDIRRIGVVALWEIGAPAVEPMLGLFASEDEVLRVNAACVLRNIVDPRIAGPMTELLKTEQNSKVRLYASKALAKNKSPEAVGPLISMVMQGGSKGQREFALQSLVSIGKPALGPMVDALSECRNVGKAEALGKTIAQIGPADTEPLVRLLESEEQCARVGAMYALADTKSRSIANKYLKILEGDTDLESRIIAVRILFKRKETRAIKPVIKLVTSDEIAPGFAGIFFIELAESMGPEAVKPLLKITKDRSSKYRAAAVAGLGAAHDGRARDAILKLVQDEDPEVRKASVNALASYCEDAKARAALVAALDDPDMDVRRDAVYASGACENADALARLLEIVSDQDGDEGLKRAAATSLGRLANDEVIGRMRESLASEKAEERKLALSVLGWAKVADAVELMNAMADDPDDGVRKVAVRQLGRLGTMKDTQMLLGMLCGDSSPEVQQAAYMSVNEIFHRVFGDNLISIDVPLPGSCCEPCEEGTQAK